MKRTSRPIPVMAGAAILAALCAAPASAQQDAARQASGAAPEPRASAALNVTVAEVMRQPDAYAGREVTVTSEVEEVLTPWAARLDEDRALAGGIDNDLLVIGTLPLATLGFDPAWKNREIRATGTVRVLQAADFLREYGRGMDNELFSRFEGKPALIATSLTVVGEPASRSSGSSGASGSTGTGAAGGEAGRPGTQAAPAFGCLPSDDPCLLSEPVWSIAPAGSGDSGNAGSGAR